MQAANFFLLYLRRVVLGRKLEKVFCRVRVFEVEMVPGLDRTLRRLFCAAGHEPLVGLEFFDCLRHYCFRNWLKWTFQLICYLGAVDPRYFGKITSIDRHGVVLLHQDNCVSWFGGHLYRQRSHRYRHIGWWQNKSLFLRFNRCFTFRPLRIATTLYRLQLRWMINVSFRDNFNCLQWLRVLRHFNKGKKLSPLPLLLLLQAGDLARWSLCACYNQLIPMGFLSTFLDWINEQLTGLEHLSNHVRCHVCHLNFWWILNWRLHQFT